jgi:hypothetical protein
MTWLKIVNVFFLQWFFIRLTKCSEKVVTNISKLLSYDLMPEGNISSRAMGTIETHTWYSIQGFIVPCTGWWNDFKYVSKKPLFWKITKVRLSL